MNDRRSRILAAIDSSVRLRGYPPTVREIGEAVGLSSPSSVYEQLRTLERMGLISWEHGKTRTLRVVRGAA